MLAGPHTDAATAAAEVHNGYGGVGAVDGGVRGGLGEGDRRGYDAPLPVLLAVTADLGRLVEECGCDIEGAKLEVWIELGILVIELLSVAVAAVLTTSAATPAAGAAMDRYPAADPADLQAADGSTGQQVPQTRAQGGRRTGRQGGHPGWRARARQAGHPWRFGGGRRGERRHPGHPGVPELHRAGARPGHDRPRRIGGRRARRRGRGSASPAWAGTPPGGRPGSGSTSGREITGEVLADSAASLATGQGLTSVEDVARAAASGATGSATGQTDHALRARLDAQTNALAGASFASPSLPSVVGVGGFGSLGGGASSSVGRLPWGVAVFGRWCAFCGGCCAFGGDLVGGGSGAGDGSRRHVA